MTTGNLAMRESRSFCPAMALAVLVGLLPAACTSTGRTLMPGQPAMLQPGESIALADASELRYLGVRSDSRCRPEVQCIRAGDADVALEFSAPGARARSITINTDNPTADAGAWRLRLLSLGFGPAPRATLQADALSR